MRQSPITDAQWLDYMSGLPVEEAELKAWYVRETGRGQSFYANRIAQLGIQGGRVLDAGCGMGNWSMALARVFDEVFALEIDANRLAVVEGLAHHYDGRIRTTLGSIGAIPFPDEHFDSIYCNGVIFLTAYATTLTELTRVLRRGGHLYLTFNGEAWWYHLIHNRGPREPNCIFYGANGLLSVVSRVLDGLAIEKTATGAVRQRARDVLATTWQTSDIEQAFKSWRDSAAGDPRSGRCEALLLELALNDLASLGGDPLRRRLASRAVESIKLLTSKTCEISLPDLVTNYRRRVILDLASRLVLHRSDCELAYQTHSFEPEEMMMELRQRGFADIVSSWEGTLSLTELAPRAAPMYDRKLGVFECLARRP